MPRFYSLLSRFQQQHPPAPPPSDADATYPNCYLEWQNAHFGKPALGSIRVPQLLAAALVASLLLAAVVVVTLASCAVGEGIIRLSTPGATAELAGTQPSILLVGYWG